MLKAIRQIWSPKVAHAPAAVPLGERVYAIGDVHGRLDLLTKLIAAIENDSEARGDAETTIVLLGDLIDRGPESAGVLQAVRQWQDRLNLRVICGNHEEMFLRCFTDIPLFSRFMQFGGCEMLLSYPLDAKRLLAADLLEAHRMMLETVPPADIAMIEAFEDFIVIGDYLFVHAGIQPGVPLGEQTVETMRWIREPFLGHGGAHDHIVVHGHTIADEPEIGHNRIGIDTGAYMSGKLTALCLEGDRRWLIETEDAGGAITVSTRAA